MVCVLPFRGAGGPGARRTPPVHPECHVPCGLEMLSSVEFRRLTDPQSSLASWIRLLHRDVLRHGRSEYSLNVAQQSAAEGGVEGFVADDGMPRAMRPAPCRSAIGFEYDPLVRLAQLSVA